MGTGEGKENGGRPLVKSLLIPDGRQRCDGTASWPIRTGLVAPVRLPDSRLGFVIVH